MPDHLPQAAAMLQIDTSTPAMVAREPLLD
jgi:hypothetical protein